MAGHRPLQSSPHCPRQFEVESCAGTNLAYLIRLHLVDENEGQLGLTDLGRERYQRLSKAAAVSTDTYRGATVLRRLILHGRERRLAGLDPQRTCRSLGAAGTSVSNGARHLLESLRIVPLRREASRRCPWTRTYSGRDHRERLEEARIVSGWISIPAPPMTVN
jgi:hypothetical protein